MRFSARAGSVGSFELDNRDLHLGLVVNLGVSTFADTVVNSVNTAMRRTLILVCPEGAGSIAIQTALAWIQASLP
jgi:hypothetical protein